MTLLILSKDLRCLPLERFYSYAYTYVYIYAHTDMSNVRWILMHFTDNLYAIAGPCTRNMTLFICSIRLHLQVMWILQSFEEFHTVDKIHLERQTFFTPHPSPSHSISFSLFFAFPRKQSFQSKYFLDLWALPKCFTAQILVFPA